MTATHKTFEWILWPQHESQCVASDEFVAEGFRVRLMGNRIEMSFEASGTCSPDLARTLAEKYVETLAKHLATSLTLITEAEWLQRTAPPFGRMTTYYTGRGDRGRVVSAVREARNELLASGDKHLRRCYDYFQDACERMHTLNDEAAYDAYKAIEVLKARFGGDDKAKAALGKIFKRAKRAASEKRHIPKNGQPQSEASEGYMELTSQVIREYERYLLDPQKI